MQASLFFCKKNIPLLSVEIEPVALEYKQGYHCSSEDDLIVILSIAAEEQKIKAIYFKKLISISAIPKHDLWANSCFTTKNTK